MRILLALFVLFTLAVAAQPARQDSSLFDFWVGEWEATWTDPDGFTAKGKNIITKILDGKVIHENFSVLTGQSKGFKGQSVSVLDGRTGQWKQTWVDNQNSYLPFTGGADGSSRFFAQEFVTPKGVTVKQKMVFRNITPGAFDWDWLKSTDGGATWTNAWQIRYTRMR